MIKHILCASLAVATSITTFASDKPDDAKAIEGKWKPVKAELSGQPMTEAVLKTISLKMDNGHYEVFVGERPDRGTYTLDSSTKPKSITVVGTEGPNQGRSFPAIFELEGDTLRICYDLSGQKRPIEFKSVAQTKLYLVTYHRAKQ